MGARVNLDVEGLRQFCTTEKQREVVDAVLKYGGPTLAAPHVSDCNERSAYRILNELRKKAAAKGWAPAHDMTRTVPDGFSVKGISSLYNQDGELSAQWVKSQKDRDDDLQSIEDALKDRFDSVRPLKRIAAPRKKLSKDLLSAYILSDAHIGMYAWGEETGDDWDLDIAQRMIVGAVKYLVDAAPNCEEGLVVNLGDYFHSDTIQNTTTRGTQLDVDTRWQKVVNIGVDALVSCIDFALEKHKRVRVINCCGNHDQHASIMLDIALRKAYRNNPRAIFTTTPSLFNYYRFGKVLIGMTHGDKRIKPDELPLIMATDKPEDWGISKHRMWFTGHLHHQRKFEPKGSNCTIETFRILGAKDAWHAGEGYRSGRELQSILLHNEYGESGRTVVTPDMLR